MSPPLPRLMEGDCLDLLRTLPPASVDAVVTDPPYHLTSIVRRFGKDGAAAAQHGTDGAFARASRGFMGKEWDGGDVAFRPETWAEVLRVLKPGGHLVAFNHSRTWHRMAAAIEDAGFDIRDSVLELYDTGPAWAGFLDTLTPDQVRALARALAASDPVLLAWIYGTGFPKSHDVARGIDKALGVEAAARAYVPASPEARAREGWGTALKPAFEPILVARAPLAERSVARQCLATGTGALNIDAARIPTEDRIVATRNVALGSAGSGVYGSANKPGVYEQRPGGRWPANVVHDGSAGALARFPVDPEGSVARFFYSAKASAADRRGSLHPTVKPHSLMRWLVRLTCPRGGLVLDPFGGSGSTAWAAHAEGCGALLIERDPDYCADIRREIAALDLSTPAPRPAEESAAVTLLDLMRSPN